MNKFVGFVLIYFCLVFPNILSANNFVVRSGAFFPSSDRFKDVYGNVVYDFQAEASVKMRSPFEFWANIDYFSKYKKHDCCCKTRVTMANASAGLKYVYHMCSKVDLYLGIGPSFGEIWLNNHSLCTKEKINKFAVGGVLKSGVYWYFCKNVFLDLFLDYLYQPVHFHENVNVGGLKAGAGIGFRF